MIQVLSESMNDIAICPLQCILEYSYELMILIQQSSLHLPRDVVAAFRERVTGGMVSFENEKLIHRMVGPATFASTIAAIFQIGVGSANNTPSLSAADSVHRDLVNSAAETCSSIRTEG